MKERSKYRYHSCVDTLKPITRIHTIGTHVITAKTALHDYTKGKIMLASRSIAMLLWILFLSTLNPHSCSALDKHNDNYIDASDGLSNLKEGKRLYEAHQYEEAVTFLWRAVLNYESTSQQEKLYNLQDAFDLFLKCFAIRGKLIDGYLFVARESFRRNQLDLVDIYLQQASEIDPDHEEVKQLRYAIDQMRAGDKVDNLKSHESSNDLQKASDLYNNGLHYFNQKRFGLAASAFEDSCRLGGTHPIFRSACTNAVYCRTNINEWGFNGKQFEKDMERITRITASEVSEYKSFHPESKVSQWRRATSVTPHMMLGYPVDPILKREVAESHAFMDEILTRFDSNTGELTPLPQDLPYDVSSRRESFKGSGKIRLGFVSAAFSSKALLYLSHDMFRFFDKSKFEVHIFSAGPPDSPDFIFHVMNGTDWRERVRENVDYFHDIQHFKDNHVELARMIHGMEIHILIEWDGYARQGDRVQGLLALRPAPIQILHQEFLGTFGGDYIDYIITDRITSPENSKGYYAEKLIYLPNHFFSKGHAVQSELNPPAYDFKPAQSPHVLGTGSPQENRCLSKPNIGPEQISFVFCNFNKFIKYNPETVRSWIEILRSVPDSIICLLENPEDGVQNFRNFVDDVASFSKLNDGDELNQRIHFLPWTKNPFNHQMRNRDFCNAVLDNYPYNGHTTAQDGT